MSEQSEDMKFLEDVLAGKGLRMEGSGFRCSDTNTAYEGSHLRRSINRLLLRLLGADPGSGMIFDRHRAEYYLEAFLDAENVKEHCERVRVVIEKIEKFIDTNKDKLDKKARDRGI